MQDRLRRVMRVEAEKCLGCGSCVDDCPKGAIALVDGIAAIERARCDGCGRCLEVCPQGAIYGVSEALPVRPPVLAARPAPPLVAQGSVPALIGRIVSGVAPVALDLAVSLVDRWLARRGAAPGVGGAIGAAGGGARRRLRRRGRW